MWYNLPRFYIKHKGNLTVEWYAGEQNTVDSEIVVMLACWEMKQKRTEIFLNEGRDSINFLRLPQPMPPNWTTYNRNVFTSSSADEKDCNLSLSVLVLPKALWQSSNLLHTCHRFQKSWRYFCKKKKVEWLLSGDSHVNTYLNFVLVLLKSQGMVIMWWWQWCKEIQNEFLAFLLVLIPVVMAPGGMAGFN